MGKKRQLQWMDVRWSGFRKPCQRIIHLPVLDTSGGGYLFLIENFTLCTREVSGSFVSRSALTYTLALAVQGFTGWVTRVSGLSFGGEKGVYIPINKLSIGTKYI